MATAVKAPVNPVLLRWAREELGLSVGEAAHLLNVKPDRLGAWEEGEGQPTVNQVRNAASLYQRTLAFFLMDGTPPEHDKKPTDFRRHDADQGVGSVVAREMGRVRTRRQRYLNLLGRRPHSLPPVEDVLQEPEDAARKVREALGVSLAEQWALKDEGAALQRWVRAVEDLDVLVFQMSRVDPETCRGFSIYEEAFPIIVLNGAESASARTFTLLHELAHLLSRTGALCDVWSKSGVERRCNIFAAEVLMPGHAFLDALGRAVPLDSLQQMAAKFKVSMSAVAVRMRDLNLITQEQLDAQLADALEHFQAKRAADKAKVSRGGPPPHLLKLRNLGPRYVNVVLDALNDERITLVDAAYYLESKISTIDRMDEELSKGARSHE